MSMTTKKEQLFQVSSQIVKVETLVDRGLSLKIHTQELGPEETTKVFELKGKQGWMIFKGAPVKPEDLVNLPEIKSDIKRKTPSQRLRSVLYVVWSKTTGQTKTFDEFYENYMGKLIDKIKEKL